MLVSFAFLKGWVIIFQHQFEGGLQIFVQNIRGGLPKVQTPNIWFSQPTPLLLYDRSLSVYNVTYSPIAPQISFYKVWKHCCTGGRNIDMFQFNPNHILLNVSVPFLLAQHWLQLFRYHPLHPIVIKVSKQCVKPDMVYEQDNTLIYLSNRLRREVGRAKVGSFSFHPAIRVRG